MFKIETTSAAHPKALLASTAYARALAYDNTASNTVPTAVGNQLAQVPAEPNTKQDGNQWVIKRSVDSSAMLPYWDLTDDIVIGLQAVRDAGEKYLPRFPLEERSDYDFRLKNVKFTNIYRDIVESLAAKPFEEEVSLVEGDGTDGKTGIPQPIDDFIEDVDGSGNNLTVFAAQTFFNGINCAVDWIFVDYANTASDPNAIRTVADEKAAGIRPHWSHVLGRNILEATSTIINGQEEWSLIRILEPGDVVHVRVMSRTAAGAVWELFEERLDKTTQQKIYVSIDRGVFSIGVIPMVPFMTGRRDGKRYFFFPAMRDAADLQIELYQSESDLKFAKKLTAYPMLAGNGVKPEKGPDNKPLPIGIGPGRVVYAPPTGGTGRPGSWVFIEPAATSLAFLQSDNKDTIENLRELGRLPLTAQSGNVTVINSAVAAGKSRSAVAAWALNLKNALEEALQLTCMWLGIDEATYSPEVNVFTEFDQFQDTAPDLTALATMRATKDLSQQTYWLELKRRRVLSPEFDAEKERGLLLGELPGDEQLDANGNPITYDANGKPVPVPVVPAVDKSPVVPTPTPLNDPTKTSIV